MYIVHLEQCSGKSRPRIEPGTDGLELYILATKPLWAQEEQSSSCFLFLTSPFILRPPVPVLPPLTGFERGYCKHESQTVKTTWPIILIIYCHYSLLRMIRLFIL